MNHAIRGESLVFSPDTRTLRIDWWWTASGKKRRYKFNMSKNLFGSSRVYRSGKLEIACALTGSGWMHSGVIKWLRRISSNFCATVSFRRHNERLRNYRVASSVDVVVKIMLNWVRETMFDSDVEVFLKKWVGNAFKNDGKMIRCVSGDSSWRPKGGCGVNKRFVM